jgi:hypothetical protein
LEAGVRLWLLGLTSFGLFSSPALAACVDPAALASSIVRITRMFDPGSSNSDPGLKGIAGTAWLRSSKEMVTAAHVAEAMKLSDQWVKIDIGMKGEMRSWQVRLSKTVGSSSEKLAILELISPLPGAAPLTIRERSLVPDESVTALGFPQGTRREAKGRFVKFGTDGRTAGSALFEMYDGDGRLALDHGASGAPIMDCTGQVVAVVSNIFARTMPFMSGAIRISTAWGSPNIVAVPISELDGVNNRQSR